MKARMLTARKCLLLHRWRDVMDTGFTVYTECKDCKSREVRQRDGGYQPVNIEWLCGLRSNDQLRSNGQAQRQEAHRADCPLERDVGRQHAKK